MFMINGYRVSDQCSDGKYCLSASMVAKNLTAGFHVTLRPAVGPSTSALNHLCQSLLPC